MTTPSCFAVFGGVYNNHLALEAVLADARTQGAEQIFCLGDIGGFGPSPNKSIEILREQNIPTMQGNYDQSIGNDLEDCQCGYTDPRDNHFAKISYEYTLAHTAQEHKSWLRDLPAEFRRDFADRRILMAHGSPRKINEFLWESTTPEPFIRRLLDDYEADLLMVTHTGLPWTRWLDGEEGQRGLINVGAIGRPANDGDLRVCYAMVKAHAPGTSATAPLSIEMRKVNYDHTQLAQEMRHEALPEEFVETILTGWWTTCMEVMPGKERAQSRY